MILPISQPPINKRVFNIYLDCIFFFFGQAMRYVILLNVVICASLKGQCYSDTQRHEGHQTPPRQLVSRERAAVFHPHGGSLHHDLCANQGADSHLGQTHPSHRGVTPAMEGESAQRICKKSLRVIFFFVISRI